MGDKKLCLPNRKKTSWWGENNIFKRAPLKPRSDLSWDWAPLERYIEYLRRSAQVGPQGCGQVKQQHILCSKMFWQWYLCHIYKCLLWTINSVSHSSVPMFLLSAKRCADLVHSSQLNPYIKCSHTAIHRLRIHLHHGSSLPKPRGMEPNLRPSVVIGSALTTQVLRWSNILVCWSGKYLWLKSWEGTVSDHAVYTRKSVLEATFV